jgi:23S rRNA pseudouridine2605 synthase
MIMALHDDDPSPADDAGQDGDPNEGNRVAKALARAGVASRREVERLIAEGRVAINGVVLSSPAVKVAPGDVLSVDGKPVGGAEQTRLWRYHKPVGLVTTHKDPFDRPTVFSHLPQGLPRVISIGRLDLNSEGLLLLTNDGALARALELPSSGWVRRYRVRARGRADQAKLDRLKAGVTVQGVRYGSIEARLDKAKESEDGKAPANLWITVAITEGKNREVRKVMESIGLQVNRLIRLSYGPFQLGTLARGEVEEIGPRVIREQLKDFIAPENMPVGDRVAAPPAVHKPVAGLGAMRRAPLADGTSGDALKPEKLVYKKGWAKPKPKAPFKGQKFKGPKRPTSAGSAGRARPGSPRSGKGR